MNQTYSYVCVGVFTYVSLCIYLYVCMYVDSFFYFTSLSNFSLTTENQFDYLTYLPT
jgi:hypothetical protein